MEILRAGVVVITLAGCAATTPSTDSAQTSGARDCGLDRFDGHVALQGALTKTKGGQLMLEGAVLTLPVPKEREDLKDEFRNAAWYGKVVEIEADRCIHTCEPGAQCLSGGEIPYLTNVRVLKAYEPS